MTTPVDMTVVGNYPSQEEASRARDHLDAVDVEPVEIAKVSDDVWEVRAPAEHRDQALAELRRMEQETIRRFF